MTLNTKKQIIVGLCGIWIVLNVCIRIFLFFSGRIIGAEFYIQFIDLLFSAICIIGLIAMIRDNSWGLKVVSIGMLGILILSLVRDYSKIIAGDVFALIKLPLILLLAYFFISFLRKDIKSQTKIT